MSKILKGVTESPQNPNKPWKAQIRVDGKLYGLGYHETEEAAARAYDNAAYYTNSCRGREVALNFSQEYSGENIPAQTPETRRVVLALDSDKPRRRPSKLDSDTYFLLRDLESLLPKAREVVEACQRAKSILNRA